MTISTVPSETNSPSDWRQGELVELEITDLSDRGDGVGRYAGRAVFVPNTVTGDRVRVRLVHLKPAFGHGKLVDVLEASPHRIRPRCIVADKCGGCQWQHVDYVYQLEAKRNLVLQALQRIGGFAQPPVDAVLNVAEPLGYRNKATYPVARAADGTVRAGYYQAGSHDLINLNQCPIQDDRLNPLLADIKQDIQKRGWSIYNEAEHRGKIRHIALRIGKRTGEMLLTLVSTDGGLVDLETQAQEWLDRYPNLVGVLLNYNGDRTNTIFGLETRSVAGQPFLQETFADLTFQILPDTFFQVHTEQAEALLKGVLDTLNLQGNEIVVDAYCGVGTFTLPIARRVAQVFGLEAQADAVDQAILNASLNEITNVSFQSGDVAQLLPTLNVHHPDIVVLDPPRKGCDRSVIDALLQMRPTQIVYVSCNPATLARDLKLLCGNDAYRLTRVQPADLFPQTAHVESVAFLVR